MLHNDCFFAKVGAATAEHKPNAANNETAVVKMFAIINDSFDNTGICWQYFTRSSSKIWYKHAREFGKKVYNRCMKRVRQDNRSRKLP